MNSMNSIAWLLPIIFMLHDFEEIVFIKVWRERYQSSLEACTMKKKPYEDFRSTDEFSIGVEILFFILSIVTLVSIIFNNYYIWYGFLFTVTAHFITAHFKLSLNFKNYVPGLVTAIIFLPINIYIIYISTKLLELNALEIIGSCAFSGVLGFILFITLKNAEKNFERLLIKFSNK
ncbi:HXXEE domain-containing protein [Clostridium sp. C8-1-8]|uniref:HXXEE domain-containing protein n=1 Tax=Clostridium sp. C8-1-8 TaxID=2698831 RepID=UPI00136D8E41|nr:HXXEE domain-containing protein [Clostridium sp. C8-1-8]